MWRPTRPSRTGSSTSRSRAAASSKGGWCRSRSTTRRTSARRCSPVAAQGSVRPDALPRRSFVYRVLQAAGAEFAALGDAAVAIGFGRPVEAEVEQARVLGLADLSPLPRTGFKGVGAVEWLVGQGVEVGPDSNRAYTQTGGELAARLAPTEVLLLDGLAGTGALVGRLDKAWAWGAETPRQPIG